ncbi:MAG: hypothetical protein ABUT11_03490 [Leifsonia sp.]
MRIGVPRWIIVGLAALFSAYVIVLGIYAIDVPISPLPAIAAMVLFAVVIALTLWPFGRSQMPIWMAAFAIASEVAITLMVSVEIDLNRPGGPSYATWYIAGVGIISTIVCTRGRPVWAWIGIVFLVVQTVLWAGPLGLVTLGVIGSASWVTVASVIRSALTRAARDARRFTIAEREATDWRAAQEAHVMERQFRLGQTSEMAARMLGTIQQRGGNLTPLEREESLNIEGAIRAEIRGRRLLNDAVRDEVMEARRRGTTITLLDEGGIDDLDEADLERVLGELAIAIRGTRADRVIARTVPEGSDVAVTVVGLNSPDEHARALGLDSGDDDEDVALWLEIPRTSRP